MIGINIGDIFYYSGKKYTTRSGNYYGLGNIKINELPIGSPFTISEQYVTGEPTDSSYNNNGARVIDTLSFAVCGYVCRGLFDLYLSEYELSEYFLTKDQLRDLKLDICMM